MQAAASRECFAPELQISEPNNQTEDHAKDPITKLISEIQDPTDPVRQKLVSYLHDMTDFCGSTVPVKDATQSKVMISVMKLVVLLKNGLTQFGKLPLPVNIIISVLSGVFSLIFNQDESLAVVKKFKNTLDERFIRKCRATTSKYKTCVLYIQGLPSSHNLDEEKKHIYLTRLASECPINTGADVWNYLADQISKLTGEDDSNNFPKLMKMTTVFCCLSVCRELFLLSRYAIEISYGLNDNSVVDVLEADRRNDANLLQFLYKPKQSMIVNFLKYLNKRDDWPEVTEFLQRRSLDIKTSSFDDKIVKIWSARYDNACLLHNFTSFISCRTRTPGQEGENARFLFRSVAGTPNVYEILLQTKRDRYVYFKHWVRYDRNPPIRTCRWRLVEVIADESEEPLFLLLNVDHIDGKGAICTDITGMVDLQFPSISNRACFWKLSTKT